MRGGSDELHGSVEELKLMLSLVRPRYFVPVHGEYRQLAQHARVASRVFAGRDPHPEILLAEIGGASPEPVVVRLQPELVVRATTAPPKEGRG